jgi:chaperonin GroES
MADYITGQDESEAFNEPDQAETQAIDPIQFLIAATQSPNMAADEQLVPAEDLANISLTVIDEYKIDKQSRDEWEKRLAAAFDLAMLVASEKNYPFERASNVKFPLLTTAALQFNARAYPAIVQGNRVAKCVTWGKDPNGIKAARAERVGEHLSYQLLSEMPEWEPDTDKLLIMAPIAGCVFRKVYWDPSIKRNATRLVTADRLVINYHARSVDDAPRLTERMHLYPYEIQERIRSGRFIQFDYAASKSEEPEENGKPVELTDDKDAPHLFLEQHRLLDLDGDGYVEPYIVTVHYASQKVCRIVANFDPKDVHIGDDGKIAAIRKRNYYIPYYFMPSPDGGIYGWGFGWLLKDIGESINTTLNQMLDAGHLTNVQGGLVSAQLGIKEKSIKLKMGEWRVLNSSVPLNQAVMPITYPGPSAVLFNLLGMLVEAGKEVSAVKDVLTGDTPANAPVGTTLALIEQGLQVFTSIYKRIHRALKAELGLLAKLNRENLDPAKYADFHDEQVDPKTDYDEADMDILPISDPNSVSKMQTLTKAMFLMEAADKDAASPAPIIDRREALKRVLEAAQIEDVDKIILPPPQPNPEEEILKRIVAMLAIKGQEAGIVKDQTAALLNVANAEKAEVGTQLAAYQQYLSFLQSQLEAAQQPPQEPQNGQGGLPGMEGPAGNAMGAPAAPPQGPGTGGAMPNAALPIDGQQPGGMVSAPIAGGL